MKGRFRRHSLIHKAQKFCQQVSTKQQESGMSNQARSCKSSKATKMKYFLVSLTTKGTQLSQGQKTTHARFGEMFQKIDPCIFGISNILINLMIVARYLHILLIKKI